MRVVEYKQYGFSLLELLIALTVVSFIMFGAVGVTSTLNDFDDYQENKKYMEKVEDAFYTFIQVNRYLPCPDVNFDGLQDRQGGPNFECVAVDGSIPYLELGVPSQDVWDEPLYYAVNNTANTAAVTNANNSASYFNNITAPIASYNENTPPFGASRGVGNYSVCAETAVVCNGATANQDIIEFAAVAVVISFGGNAGNTWALRNAGNVNQLSNPEAENADGDNFFWQARGESARNQNNEFDDQVFWITGYDMKYSIIKSGGGF